MSFTQVTVTGTVLVGDSAPAAGALVTLILSEGISDGTSIVIPAPVQAVCATDGTFSVAVDANNDPTTLPTGSTYKATIVYLGQTVYDQTVTISHLSAPTVDLFTVAP